MNAEKPTELQLRIAEKLHIGNATSMTKAQLNKTFAEMLDPAFDDYEGKVIDQIDDAINASTPTCRYALTLYQKGTKHIVDVLQFEGMQSDDSNRIYLECTIPQIDRSGGAGFYCPEWNDKLIEITIDKILFFFELPDDYDDRSHSDFNMDYYRQTVLKGVNHARTAFGVEPDVNPIAIPKQAKPNAIPTTAQPVTSTRATQKINHKKPPHKRRSYSRTIVRLIVWGSLVFIVFPIFVLAFISLLRK